MVENKRKAILEQVLLNSYFIICSLFFIVPLILVITSSISRDSFIEMYGYSLFPREISFAAYESIFKVPKRIIDAYYITAFTSIVGTFMSVITMGLMAYSLSRRDFAYRGILTKLIFFTMLFSGGLIPSYIINTQFLRLNDTVWIYLLPGMVSAWFIIIMRTFFQQLPIELVESAKIDGAGEYRIFFTIILPLSKPLIATISLFCLLARWNEWMTTLIYVTNERLFTLQYILQRILREAEFARGFLMNVPGAFEKLDFRELPSHSMRYAMTLLAAGPMLIIFPFFQKYFTKGITIGAVKG